MIKDIIENPPYGSTFTPVFPYNQYYIGYITKDRRDDRRICTIYDKFGNVIQLAYARYIQSVIEGRILNRDEAVHHKDFNRINDTINNLELLSVIEHARLHKAFVGKMLAVMICPICRQLFVRPLWQTRLGKMSLVLLSYCNDNCRLLHNKTFNVTSPKRGNNYQWLGNNQILYIIKQYTDDKYTIPRSEILEYGSRKMLDEDWTLEDDNGNVVDFSGKRYISTKEKIDTIDLCKRRNMSNLEIARLLQISHITISTLINKYLPKYSEKVIMDRKINKIKELLDSNYSRKDIAKLMDYSEYGLNSVIRNHLPSYLNKTPANPEEMLLKINTIEELLKNGHTRQEITNIIKYPYGEVNGIILKHLPHYKTRSHIDKSKMIEIKKNIKDLLQQNISRHEIANKLNISYEALRKIISRHIEI